MKSLCFALTLIAIVRPSAPGDGFGNAGTTYPKLRVPTLILKVDADANSRKKHIEIARLLPKGTLVHIEGAGHIIRNDRPEETEREIRAFLSRS